ncbi:hypothetical protein H8959_015831, partial [Pygathrix nigripes]
CERVDASTACLHTCVSTCIVLAHLRVSRESEQSPACAGTWRNVEKAAVCLQEHVVIDMYPGPVSLATSRGTSPMTPPLAWPPPTSSATATRMGTISSEPKDPAQVPALRSCPPSRQRTSWTPKAMRGRLQTADLRPPVAPAAPGQKGPPSSRTEPRAPWS